MEYLRFGRMLESGLGNAVIVAMARQGTLQQKATGTCNSLSSRLSSTRPEVLQGSNIVPAAYLSLSRRTPITLTKMVKDLAVRRISHPGE